MGPGKLLDGQVGDRHFSVRIAGVDAFDHLVWVEVLAQVYNTPDNLAFLGSNLEGELFEALQHLLHEAVGEFRFPFGAARDMDGEDLRLIEARWLRKCNLSRPP